MLQWIDSLQAFFVSHLHKSSRNASVSWQKPVEKTGKKKHSVYFKRVKGTSYDNGCERGCIRKIYGGYGPLWWGPITAWAVKKDKYLYHNKPFPGMLHSVVVVVL